MSPRFSLRVLAAQSDERLAELVRQGHEVAFEALAKRYRRRLLRYCRRLGLGDAGAEDVVQQALLQAWLALAAGREVRHIRAWLFRIAHNAASNARRRIAAWQVCLSDPGDARSALALEMYLERVVAARSALGEVAALPAMQR